MAVLGTGVRACWGSAPLEDLDKKRASAGGQSGEALIAGVKPKADGDEEGPSKSDSIQVDSDCCH